jgi:hypothetical protein
MKITVKLFTSFQVERFNVEIREYPEPTLIGDVVREQDIPEEKIWVVLLNAVHAKLHQRVERKRYSGDFPSGWWWLRWT